MATFYILCKQRDGLPIENITDDMNSSEDWSVSGRIWGSREQAEAAATFWAWGMREDGPVMLRTVEL